MNSALISQIIEKIKENISSRKSNFVRFSNKDYVSMQLDAKNFHEIAIKQEKQSQQKIAFIDGGNQEIIGSPDFSLQAIRTACVVYKENQRLSIEKNEFYVLIYSAFIDGEINYCTEIYSMEKEPILKDKIIINSMDGSLKQGNKRVNISSIGNVIRRYAELRTAIKMAENLDKNDMMILDGTLECEFTGEYELFEKLYETAKNKDAIVCALSKTTNLYTDSGNSVVNFLNQSAFKTWYYHPIVDINISTHRAKMYFVKLHKIADYIFRFEVFNKSNYDIDDVLSTLMENSKDPVFLGYPYGLIEADRFARVTNNEIGYYRTIFNAVGGQNIKEIQSSIRMIDAHSILDNVS